MELAQGITNPVLNQNPANQGLSFFQRFIPNALTMGLIIGSVIFVWMLVWGAIDWISSGGDKAKLESARNKVTNAIIGVVVLFALYAVANLVSTFFGNIPILKPVIKPLV